MENDTEINSNQFYYYYKTWHTTDPNNPPVIQQKFIWAIMIEK